LTGQVTCDIVERVSRTARGVILSVAVGAGLYVALAAGYGEGRQVLTQLRQFSPLLLLLGLALASANYLFRFVRWQYYLRLLDVPTWPQPRGQAAPGTHFLSLYDSLLIFVAGFALTVTPGKVGEVLKSYLLRESYQQPIAKTAPIVLAERLTDLIGLLLLMLLGVASWMQPAHHYLLAIGLFLCLLLLLLASWRSLVYAVLALLEKLPSLGPKLVPKLREFYDAAYVLVRPVPLLAATLTSICSWFAECLAFYLMIRGFSDGGQASVTLATFIYAVMTVAGALAFVPGGLGVTEGGMALLLSQLAAMSKSSAVAVTLIIRAQTLWFAVLLGVLALLVFSRRQQVALSLDQVQKQTAPPPTAP
jgi:uncharacterized protein (TIRG00374 family)